MRRRCSSSWPGRCGQGWSVVAVAEAFNQRMPLAAAPLTGSVAGGGRTEIHVLFGLSPPCQQTTVAVRSGSCLMRPPGASTTLRPPKSPVRFVFRYTAHLNLTSLDIISNPFRLVFVHCGDWDGREGGGATLRCPLSFVEARRSFPTSAWRFLAFCISINDTRRRIFPFLSI